MKTVTIGGDEGANVAGNPSVSGKADAKACESFGAQGGFRGHSGHPTVEESCGDPETSVVFCAPIEELYVTISEELKMLDGAEDEEAQTVCLRAIQVAMDRYKAEQTKNDFKMLRNFFAGDGMVTTELPELDDFTSEGVEVTLRQEIPLRLFFDNVSTVMFAGKALLDEGLSSAEDPN